MGLATALAAVLVAVGMVNDASAGLPVAPAAVAGPAVYTVSLAVANPVTVAAAGLSIELVAVKDGRCAQELRCVWAGHAALSLRVGMAGRAVDTITLGTPAPPGMGLPSEARYGGYRFVLLALEPAPSLANPVAQSAYRASVQVSADLDTVAAQALP